MGETIRGVKAEDLDNYNPERYDAVKNADGTFDLVPVRWWDQASYNAVQYGCGSDD